MNTTHPNSTPSRQNRSGLITADNGAFSGKPFDSHRQSIKLGQTFMNFLTAPSLKLCAVLGAALLLLGCKAQVTNASQDVLPAKPALTNVLTNTTSETSLTNAEAELPPVPEIKLSPGLQEIVDMAERGVGDEVLMAYIENSPLLFTLTPEDILFLTDIGFSENVIAALIKHGRSTKNLAQKPANIATNLAPATLPTPLPVDPAPSVTITATPEFETAPQQPQVTYVLPPAQVDYNYFYSSLDPYGSWVDVGDYGLCWRPTVAVVNPAWRPYSDRGRWLYTDCGWYWQSDYSWGWAPFHYGRWHSHPRSGWVWVPDRTWGPAWVSWRHNDSYAGWAPLPPGARFERGFGLRFNGAGVGVSFDFGLRRDAYTFVHKSRFYDRTPWKHSLSSAQVVNVYNNTTVVNNYGHGSNNTIINEGVGRDHIARHTRSEIRKVSIRDVPADDTRRHIKAERLENNGTELAVYRPNLPETDKAARRGSQEGRKGTGAGVRSASVESRGSRINSASAAPPQSLRPSQPEATPRSLGNTIRSTSRRTDNTAAVPTVSSPQPSTTASAGSSSTRPLAGPRFIRPTVENREAASPQTPSVAGGGRGSSAAAGNQGAPTPSNNGTVANAQPAKSAQELRGSPNTRPQLVHTPVNPIQRERPQPISRSSIPVQTGQTPGAPNSIASSRDAMSARRTTDPTARTLERRPYTPAAPQPAQPTFSSPGIVNQQAQRPSSVVITPSSPSETRSRYPGQAAQQYPSALSSRQELQKPFTQSRPETPGYSQPSRSYERRSPNSAPSYQPSQPRSAPSAPQYTPNPSSSRQYSAPAQSVQSRPNFSAPSSPPAQVQSRQNSSSPSSAPPSSSSSSGSGRRRD
jgi:hypothetical protein